MTGYVVHLAYAGTGSHLALVPALDFTLSAVYLKLAVDRDGPNHQAYGPHAIFAESWMHITPTTRDMHGKSPQNFM